ncbi:MAG: HEAT repeat domain-containing protein [Desulfosarcinaceae bacterium]
MADTEKPHTGQSEPGPPESIHQQICDVIFDLNIARKNTLIYPSDHEQVQRSVQKAFDRLSEFLGTRKVFNLTVMKSGFMFREEMLDPRNPALKEFSAALRQQGVAAIAFQEELQKDELERFLGLLTLEPPDAMGASEQNAPARDRHKTFKHIQLHLIDYSRLRLTEEAEIQRGGGAAKPDSAWRELVASVTGHPPGQGQAGGDEVFDPAVLAEMMNSSRGDLSVAVDHYKKTLSQRMTQDDPDKEDAGEATDDGLPYFNLLIQKLNPELQQQFLAVAFDELSHRPQQEAATKMMQNMGQDVLMQMLQYAETGGKEISPSLLKLIQQIGHLPSSPRHVPASAQLGGGESAGDLRELFNREDYEVYVDEQYDQLLSSASLTPGSALSMKGLPLDLQTGIEDKQVNAHAALALMRLMVVSKDLEGYRDWARQLTLVFKDLADNEAFECLAQILKEVQEEQHRQDGEKKKIAALVARSFSEPEFVSSLVSKVEKAGQAARSAASALLSRIGEPVMLEILDALDKVASQEEVRQKIILLEPFGTAAAREAAQRTNDPRPKQICMMLQVVRALGNAQVAQDLRLLLDHDDAEVRMASLAVLLKFKNPWGILRLRELLSRPWSEETAQAMGMAGEYKVSEVRPVLLNFVTRGRALATDFERRTDALRALGRIGDPASVPVLEKIARRRPLFAKKNLLQFKQVMFESLAGYPFRDVEHLIMIGVKEKDETIRETCRKLLRAHHIKTRSKQDPKKASDHAS